MASDTVGKHFYFIEDISRVPYPCIYNVQKYNTLDVRKKMNDKDKGGYNCIHPWTKTTTSDNDTVKDFGENFNRYIYIYSF